MFPLSVHPHPRPGMTPYAQRTIRRALNILERQLREPGAAFTTSSSVRDWLRLQLTQEQREEFSVLFLDNQNRLIAHEILFTGTVSHTEVHPREVVKAALKHNAAAVIVAHNHPSGLAEPSQADRRLTERLKLAMELIEVRLLDHLVVGGMEITSFAERGWL
ncbi:RadC family protein [Enterobacter kobei]|uniref:RadC family protein n=1 Tax=Enterobacter kobei TaxID=208224 RepID=UPI003D6EBBA1